jgi:1-acyl-sn-glycerol-3-phosphate acyltransferase
MTGMHQKSHDVAASRSMKPLRSMLLTVSFYPLMIAWIVIGLITSPLVFLLCKVSTGWETARIIRFIIWIHGRGLLVIIAPFISLTRTNLNEIQRPCILVVNHLSFFDGYFMAALPFFDMAFAVGAWPFRMFWYTVFMRMANYLDVESTSWEETLEICRKVFASNAGVLFFPEGHRSRTGQMQQFQSGAFRLAIETGMPIVPLCITGTDILLPPGSYRLHPARIKLKALPPVDPAAFTGSFRHIKMRKHVHSLMAGEVARMKEESC